ncbi:MAG: DNA translocase FtsK [Oscillospiraceae bacterium]|nr:DNA translocase FtsK [Oscillospiraceae bacterium]
MGIMGAGVYVLPFALLLDFVVLLFHDGRPVRLRVISSWIVTLCVGMLVHLLSCKEAFTWGFPMVIQLWRTGVSGISGGALAGLLSMLLALCIHKVGAVILCIISLIVFTLLSFNMTIGGVIRAIRSRPRVEYAPPVREHRDPAEVAVEHVSQRHIERTERKREHISNFDLPVDDGPAEIKPERKKRGKRQEEPAEETLDIAVLPESVAEPVEDPFEDVIELREQPVPLVVKKERKAHESAEADEVETALLPLDPDMPQKVKKEEAQQEAMKIATEIAQSEDAVKPYRFPELRLLKEGSGTTIDGTEEMQANAERIDNTLASFGIDAHIVNAIRGSSITSYELELDRGVRLSKITNLADDIALSLGASGVRISAIPDKISVVGIEVPNKLVSMVHIHEVISSAEFGKSKSKISFAVGKDINGRCVVGDIAKLPHLLIAGTTGSGKSVCMNSLIVSLLYKAKPEEVRLIMVDPKMVELGIYNGIPHLLIPVVTDPKKAAGALQWGVTEMMKRYRLMADAGVRDLESYNRTCGVEPDREKLPQIVVVIDELADLMLVAAKEVEESICRIAQMGRAAGIHLVIATQRPSADVITGLMKANIPSRIAFAVASAMESRIILDTAGAEKLVGKGDMLYSPLGQGKPKRVQGCFIDDEEVQAVVDRIKENALPSYDDDVMDQIEKKAAQSGKTGGASAGTAETEAVCDGDELLPAAVEVLLETGQGSVSMLQRRLKLGYARAARIMDEMEEKGIVGPFEGSKPRHLLITKDQWLQMQGLAPETAAEEEEQEEDDEAPF